MLLNFLLPKFHFFAFAGFGLLGPAGAITVRAALGHAPVKRGRRMVDMPPVPLAAHVAAVTRHRLQVEAGAQAFGGDGVGDSAAIAAVENTVPGHISRFVPEAAQAFEKAKEIVQSFCSESSLNSGAWCVKRNTHHAPRFTPHAPPVRKVQSKPRAPIWDG